MSTSPSVQARRPKQTTSTPSVTEDAVVTDHPSNLALTLPLTLTLTNWEDPLR